MHEHYKDYFGTELSDVLFSWAAAASSLVKKFLSKCGHVKGTKHTSCSWIDIIVNNGIVLLE